MALMLIGNGSVAGLRLSQQPKTGHPSVVYFVLNVCRSGTTESTDTIFIPCSPPPASQAQRAAGPKEEC